MFIKSGHCSVKQAGGTQNEVMWYPPCCFLSIFYYPQSSITTTPAFWLPRINKGKTKTCKFSTESWCLPMLITTLKQVWGIETTIPPLSFITALLAESTWFGFTILSTTPRSYRKAHDDLKLITIRSSQTLSIFGHPVNKNDFHNPLGSSYSTLPAWI